MSYLPNPDLVDPPIQCGKKDGQKTYDADVISGPFSLHLTEPSNTAYQSWRDISHPSQSATSSYLELSRYNTDTESGSACYMSKWGFPTTRSGNSLINDDDHDGDSFGCLRATFKGARPIQQKIKQLVTRMMVPNEEQISREPNVAVRRNPNIGIVCNSRVQISCCHVVSLPFNDGRCQVCKEPVEDIVEHL